MIPTRNLVHEPERHPRPHLRYRRHHSRLAFGRQGGADGGRLKGIAFRALDGDLGRSLLQAGGQPLHVAGKLRPDRWAGPDAVQLIIEDAASVGR